MGTVWSSTKKVERAPYHRADRRRMSVTTGIAPGTGHGQKEVRGGTRVLARRVCHSASAATGWHDAGDTFGRGDSQHRLSAPRYDQRQVGG